MSQQVASSASGVLQPGFKLRNAHGAGNTRLPLPGTLLCPKFANYTSKAHAFLPKAHAAAAGAAAASGSLLCAACVGAAAARPARSSWRRALVLSLYTASCRHRFSSTLTTHDLSCRTGERGGARGLRGAFLFHCRSCVRCCHASGGSTVSEGHLCGRATSCRR